MEHLCNSRPPMSLTMKIRKLKLFYFQKNARYRVKELCGGIFLGNLSLKEGKISVGLPVLILEFWCRHVKTKNTIQLTLIFKEKRNKHYICKTNSIYNTDRLDPICYLKNSEKKVQSFTRKLDLCFLCQDV